MIRRRPTAPLAALLTLSACSFTLDFSGVEGEAGGGAGAGGGVGGQGAAGVPGASGSGSQGGPIGGGGGGGGSSSGASGSGGGGGGGGGGQGAGGAGGSAGGGGSGGAPKSYAEAVRDNEPFAYFRFEFPGPTSNQVVDDIGSALGNVTAGPPLGRESGAIAGETGSAAHFDGTTVTFDEGFDFAPGSPYTFEFWVRPDEGGSPAPGAVFSRLAPDTALSDFHGYFCAAGRGGALFNFQARNVLLGGTNETVNAGGPLPTGAFTYVAIVSDGDKALKIYIDGQQVDARANADLASTGDGVAFVMGVSQLAPDFRGAVDEFAIYAKQLPDSVIAEHYAIGRNAPGARAR
ncbi:MAG TPA: LamG domain-containing protein [Polyangiaceae bacterium]|nr:LamG domain-containing protein [Polyangiaceae bacterium]